MTTVVTWIGYTAGTLTTIAFFPQVLQVWKTKRAEDLHIGTLVGFIVGITLWMVYGILLHDAPIIVANFVTLVLQGTIVFLKLKYARAGKRAGL
jgi:MtN3 and saliva related transmembrane protein